MEPKVFWSDNVARGVWQLWLAMNHAALILMGDWCALQLGKRNPPD